MQSEALREFSRIPILSALTSSETFDIIRLCRVRNVSAGETLFRQDETSRSMCIIEKGVVEVRLERESGHEVLARFGSFEVVGEMSLLDPGPRSATAFVVEDATVYEIDGSDFEGLLAARHTGAYKIVRALARIVARRIRAVNERIEAELAGAPAPPPFTGQHERVRATGAQPMVSERTVVSVTGAQPTVGPGRPEASVTGQVTGMFRRVLQRVWGSEDE